MRMPVQTGVIKDNLTKVIRALQQDYIILQKGSEEVMKGIGMIASV